MVLAGVMTTGVNDPGLKFLIFWFLVLLKTRPREPVGLNTIYCGKIEFGQISRSLV